MSSRIGAGGGGAGWTWYNQPLSMLCNVIEMNSKIPVIDRTDLTQHYDYSLNWERPDGKISTVDSLNQALIEQLGLELVPGKETIEMLVVTRTNN